MTLLKRATNAIRSLRARLLPFFLGAIVLILALLPRTGDLRAAYMIDEALWLDRSERFVDAVASLDPSRAFTTGHPGVTTMWIGGIAQRTLPDDATLTQRYERSRLAVGVVAAFLILLLWWLARPLAGEAGAFVGALLVAFDPFLLAHNRVLHLDGLHALTTIGSLVALLRYRRAPDRRMLAVSGVLCGLALLTRTLTTAPLVLSAAVLLVRRFGVKRFAIWCGVAAGVFVLAWPLVWVRPWKAAWLLFSGAERAAGAESDAGRFFLGDRVNPGPLYYFVVFAFRSSIVTLPGLLVASAWAVWKRKREQTAATVGILLAFGATLLVALTLADKKADRYVLPMLLAVDLAAAVVLVKLLRERVALLGPVVALTLALHAGPAIALHPFELAHFNWLAGGPQAARGSFVIGRGEGLETAARELSRRIPVSTIATTRVTQFREFYGGRTVSLATSDLVRRGGVRADFVLFYISSVQTGRYAGVYRRYASEPPVYTLSINGLPYVQVWRVRR